MALWNGSTINSTETATVFNQIYNREKPIAMIRKKNGLLYAILGKQEQGSTPGSFGFERMEKISGSKVEVTLLGRLKTIATVSDGANEMAAATLTNDQNYWGAAEFALAHYKDAHGLPESELHRYEGDELKTASYIDNTMEMLTLSLENTIGTAMYATGSGVGPSRTVFGSVLHAVSDGVSTGETNYNSYGTINRSDSANADFRSTVTTGVGDLTLAKIQTLQNTVIAAGGNPNVGVTHTTPYTKIQTLVQNYTHSNYDEQWSHFGGPYVEFSGIKFTLDQRCPSDTLLLIDPSVMKLYKRDINFTNSGIVQVPNAVASYVLNWGAWLQLINVRPSSCGKLTGITS